MLWSCTYRRSRLLLLHLLALSVLRAESLPTSITGFREVVIKEGKARGKELLFAVSLETHRATSRQDGRA